MILNDEISGRFPIPRGLLPFIVLFASLLWAPIETLAQEATLTEAETTWLIQRPESNRAPKMPLPLEDRQNVASNSAPDSISRLVYPAALAHRPQKVGSGTLVVATLFAPAAVARGHRNVLAERSISDPRGAPELIAKPYRLLDTRPADGLYRYRYDSNYLPVEQSLMAGEPLTLGSEEAPRPLWHLSVGNWRLPVLLSRPTIPR
jgi:hypothetical protein